MKHLLLTLLITGIAFCAKAQCTTFIDENPRLISGFELKSLSSTDPNDGFWYVEYIDSAFVTHYTNSINDAFISFYVSGNVNELWSVTSIGDSISHPNKPMTIKNIIGINVSEGYGCVTHVLDSLGL